MSLCTAHDSPISCGGQAEWADTADTIEGHRVHARVDRANKPLPDPDDLESGEDKVASRSLTLSSRKLGAIAKMMSQKLRTAL